MPEQQVPDSFPLTILTPAGTVFHGDVKEMTLKGPIGVFQIHPLHEPMLSPLSISNMSLRVAGAPKDTQLAVHGGFLEVTTTGATILADVAELGSSIDPERAREALKRAEERLAKRTDKDALDMDRAQLALMRALARIGAIEGKEL